MQVSTWVRIAKYTSASAASHISGTHLTEIGIALPIHLSLVRQVPDTIHSQDSSFPSRYRQIVQDRNEQRLQQHNGEHTVQQDYGQGTARPALSLKWKDNLPPAVKSHQDGGAQPGQLRLPLLRNGQLRTTAGNGNPGPRETVSEPAPLTERKANPFFLFFVCFS